MNSQIAGPVTFYSLNKHEPRICVIEDGVKTFYYSDGRFKPNGSVVLDFKGSPKFHLKKIHIDNEGNPINLPTNLDDSSVMIFLSKYNFITDSLADEPLNLDWIKIKERLHQMCRYYNLFSLNDKEKKSHVNTRTEYRIPSVREWEREWENYSRDKSDENRYIVRWEPNMNSNYSERNKLPFTFSVMRINLSAGTYYYINYFPFRFINEKAAHIFIENFQSDLTEVIRGWNMLLLPSSSIPRPRKT